MKDAYSFDLDESGLDSAFEVQRAAYVRIFERLGIPAIAVEASSGIMGGGQSVEFMCPTEAGEDLVVHCECGYAANIEKASSRLAPITDEPGSVEAFDTPGARTIEDLARDHGFAGERQIKTLVYVVDDRLTLVLMRGDHALVETKLVDALGAVNLRAAQPDEIQAALGALPGSLGAVGVTDLPVVADEALRGRFGMATGANRDGVHLKGVDVARDIVVGQWADLREVTAGEPCPRCGRPLEREQTVEIGHIFKLGKRYTETLGVTVLGPDGSRVTPTMGCYGIGVERAIAAVVETHHDERGIVWPAAIAPFQVAIAALGKVGQQAGELYEALRANGIEVILDDRDERPGVKFSDIELIGVPLRITVSERGLTSGTVEVTNRSTGETERVAVADAPGHVARIF